MRPGLIINHQLSVIFLQASLVKSAGGLSTTNHNFHVLNIHTRCAAICPDGSFMKGTRFLPTPPSCRHRAQLILVCQDLSRLVLSNYTRKCHTCLQEFSNLKKHFPMFKGLSPQTSTHCFRLQMMVTSARSVPYLLQPPLNPMRLPPSHQTS